MTYLPGTYYGCKGLTGVWEGATDETLMPARVTAHSNTVGNTSTSLRGYFLTSCGGTRTS